MNRTRLVEILKALREDRTNFDAAQAYISINYGQSGLNVLNEFMKTVDYTPYDAADDIVWEHKKTLDEH
jgi:hypothetical protein